MISSGIPTCRANASDLSRVPANISGAVSYCIYLVNEPVQKLVGVTLAMVVQGNAALFTMIWIPGAVVLPLLVSWWLHEWVELPAQHYGRAMAVAAVTAG